MKNYVALVGGVALSLLVSQAFAFPIEAGDTVHLKGLDSIWSVVGKRPFSTTADDGTVYDSFCLESKVKFWDGDHTVSSVSDTTERENDKISDFTKWIYAAYQEGDILDQNVDNYGEDVAKYYNTLLRKNWEDSYKFAHMLQEIVWYEEDEKDDSWIGQAHSSLYQYMQASETQWEDYANDGWEVKVVNFENEGALSLRKVQSQLVGYKDPNTPPSEVPEPATMALFGLGLLGFVGVARKRNKK